MHLDRSLTDDEGTLLALVYRAQPITAYQVAKIYESSPVASFGTSPGKIYPLVKRLKQRGLLEADPIARDRRGTELLTCTRQAEDAIRGWLMDIRDTFILLDDPLRTRVQSFGLLTSDERRRWILDRKAEIGSKLAEVEAYKKTVTVPYIESVHDNAMRSLRARLDWLDSLLVKVLSDEVPSGYSAEAK